LNIIVCIKQVPGSSNVKVDPVTGTLQRDAANTKMNPYDLYALEMALQLREKYGGSLRVVTMGPNAAAAVIKEALYMGAESGVLVSDRRFAGADVIATSYALAQAIGCMGSFDLIICGKQTTDGDTAQVGAELAEFLGIPHCANVTELSECGKGYITTVSMLDNKIITSEIRTPCLICAEGEINTPRLPSYRRKCSLEKDETLIDVMNLDCFEDKDPKRYGSSGSPTRVERIFPPEKNLNKEIFEGEKATGKNFFAVLKNRKFV